VIVSLGLSAISLIGLLMRCFTGVGWFKRDRQAHAACSAGEAVAQVGILLGKFQGCC